jgi:hypothetical protein
MTIITPKVHQEGDSITSKIYHLYGSVKDNKLCKKGTDKTPRY